MTAGSLLAGALLMAWSMIETLLGLYLVWTLMGFALATVLYEPAFAVLAVWFDRRRAAALTAAHVHRRLRQRDLPAAGGLVGRDARMARGPAGARLGRVAGHGAAARAGAAAAPARRRPGGRRRAAGGGRRCPAPRRRGSGRRGRRLAPTAPASVAPADAFRSAAFRWLTVSFTASMMVIMALGVHLVPVLEARGLSAAEGAAVGGAVGLLALPGRLVFTPLGAVVSRHLVTAAIFVAQAAGLAALLAWPGPVGLGAFVLLYGIGFGAITPARAALVVETFGPAWYGTIAGRLALIGTLARAAAPVALGWLVDRGAGYDGALVALVALALVAAVTVALAGRPGGAGDAAVTSGMDAPAYVPGDALPGAPALAARGPRAVGVTTLTLSNPYQIDVLGSLAAGEALRSTRTLAAEVWYPAATPGGPPTSTTSRPTPTTPTRRRARSASPGGPRATPNPTGCRAPAPSWWSPHGYPGSRFILSGWREPRQQGLRRAGARPHRQHPRRPRRRPLGAAQPAARRRARARVGRRPRAPPPAAAPRLGRGPAALVGFSMGGYGTLWRSAPGSASTCSTTPSSPSRCGANCSTTCVEGHPSTTTSSTRSPRKVDAAVLLAPWGGDETVDRRRAGAGRTPLSWRPAAPTTSPATPRSAGCSRPRRAPSAGSSPSSWPATTSAATRRPTALATAGHDDWWRYADPVWDVRRIVNVLQHHLTAFLGVARPRRAACRSTPGYLDGARRARRRRAIPGPATRRGRRAAWALGRRADRAVRGV
jgi:hypothetical protein